MWVSLEAVPIIHGYGASMSCNITRPNPQDLFNRIKSRFSANVLGGSEIVPESNEWYVVANDYAMQEELYSLAEQQWRERDPRYACCENLIDMAAKDGVYPRPASGAQGYVRITGTAGAQLSQAIDMAFGGVNFRTIGNVPSTIDDNGEAVVRVQALVPGDAGNSAPANDGRLITSLADVDRTVIAYGSLFCGGADAEECEAFRTRYLARKQYQPRATLEWIRSKILEWPCVTRVCERSGSCCEYNDGTGCGGKLEFYAMFDNSFDCGLAPQCAIDDLNIWLWGERQGYGEGQVDIGLCGQVYTATASPIDIIIDGASCGTSAQRSQIEDVVRDIFSRLCPSQDLRKRPFDLAIAQILGDEIDFNIEFETEADGASIDPYCGDVEIDCDYMACLGSVTFINNTFVNEACA